MMSWSIFVKLSSNFGFGYQTKLYICGVLVNELIATNKTSSKMRKLY